MSMPSFPPCGADMTKDEALTMIIASIAMEELALSHIVNAEGEKLQYVLGTLPGSRGTCAGAQEILAVNKSVKELLDTVTQSQMLLKGKLEKALEAGGYAPKPLCPCGSAHPDGPFCAGGPCCRKSAIQLTSQCNGFSWNSGVHMFWKRREQRGCSIHWSEKAPMSVGLDAGRSYTLDYTINVRSPYRESGTGAVLVKIVPCDVFSGVLPLYFSAEELECKPMTLHYSATLFPQACQASSADLSLLLNYRDSLFVDQAFLSIVEV